MDFSDKRQNFNKKELSEEDLGRIPHLSFDEWMKEALEVQISEPYAMSLATSDTESTPSVRTVYLRSYHENSFIFYTNYNSQKGKELIANPKAALLFFWPELERQIRIQGKVEKVSAEISDTYWDKRPELSRIASKSSPQSQEIAPGELQKNVDQTKETGDFSRPDHWGGFALTASKYEFWQGRPARMHDRIIYHLDETGHWKKKRLAP